MSHVLILVRDPRKGPLQERLLADVRRILADHRASPTDERWLASGEAWEAEIPAGETLVTDISAFAEASEIDFAILPAAGRRKRVLVADMESTVIREEMLDELARSIGLGEEISRITARAMAGELDFAEALRTRVGLLAGLPRATLEQAAGRMTVDPGARTLVATMRANGARCVLVSGGFEIFAEPIGLRVGFDKVRANRLEIEDGRLTGRVEEPILGREAKLGTLREISAELGCTLAETCAVGDGANDLAMIEAAGLGVAFHGKPAVRAAARIRIDHGDLSVLLYFQGYDREEFEVSGQ